MTRNLSPYDAGRRDAFAEAWLAATDDQYCAERWAARATSDAHRRQLLLQADAAAVLAVYFAVRLSDVLGPDARGRCLDEARQACERWQDLRVRGQAFQAARRAEATAELLHA